MNDNENKQKETLASLLVSYLIGNKKGCIVSITTPLYCCLLLWYESEYEQKDKVLGQLISNSTCNKKGCIACIRHFNISFIS